MWIMWNIYDQLAPISHYSQNDVLMLEDGSSRFLLTQATWLHNFSGNKCTSQEPSGSSYVK